MSIEVNTVTKGWVENETVTELLRRMNFIYPMVIVKIDGEIIPKAQYDVRKIKDGSVISVLHLESGG
ncbi:MAG: sulfur carrier protein ThiS [Thermoplasmata archaeon]|nr:sulfur carrier protein ThiS [Thermoplasmata archaeon]